ncbi:MAG: type II toxin-antitoxin system VapC family toxin [Actinomycetota bacterium]|nr:type II toxin-antitoxin system VapC family toxin [Actinomycetota bacterium]
MVDALTAVDGTTDLRTFMAREELSAPALLDFEFVSALRGLTRRGHLTVDRAEDALTDFDDLEIRRWPSADALRRRVFQLRDTVSAYHAAYVVLAEALDCALLTRDVRLARSSGHLVPIEVR